MEDKVLKQFKSSCAFPLFVITTRVNYNEVKRASGISYILLDLILKSEDSEEKISDVLFKFGIPFDLHHIFGNEISILMANDILVSSYNDSHFNNPLYFKQLTLGDVQITSKGKKMFVDGFVPTGAEKCVVKDVYFNPVTRKYEVESKVSCFPITESFLDDDFIKKLDLDLSGMEDYINANGIKFGIKAEERIVSFEKTDIINQAIEKENGMNVCIYIDHVSFSFDTSDENAFFKKFYTSEMISKNLKKKEKFNFINANKKLVSVPTKDLKEIKDIENIYLPDEGSKLALRPCKFFLNKNRLNLTTSDVSTKINSGDSTILLNDIDENAEFGLIDKNGFKYYVPYNAKMDCDQLNTDFEIPLLIEKIANENQYRNLLLNLYEIYYKETFKVEDGKSVLFIIESLNDPSYFKKYLNKQLELLKKVDEKIELLLEIHNSFKTNNDWCGYFRKTANELFENSLKEIQLTNMIHKNICLTPLKNELGLSDVEYINKFSGTVKSENHDLIYQALETAGFDINLILGVINVVDDYMDKIIYNQRIDSDTNISDNFKIVSINLWKLNNILGIKDFANYTIKDDFNIDEFFNLYGTLAPALKSIEKYSRFSQEKFSILFKYMNIFNPIHEFLSIERESSSHPEKITKKYINDYISKGRFKNAICDLSVKLQFDLRKALEANIKTEAFELINKAKDKNIINHSELVDLHKMRKIRNGFQHPELEQEKYNKNDIERWRDLVFKIGEKNEPNSNN